MARGYETLIIAHPEVIDEEIHALEEKIKEVIARSEGECLSIEKLGKRKLVYKIKGFLKGYFFIVYFTGQSRILQELDRLLRYNERVLRYQTLRLDQGFDLESLRKEKPPEPGESSESEPSEESSEQEASKEETLSEGAEEVAP
ncbi:MAG: 30S ribosomal protein S6 [Pseudomonadota bacterium]